MSVPEDIIARAQEESIAIRIEGLFKEYRLGQIGGGTLQRDLQSWWARKRGKEDPNLKIGANPERISGERFLALRGIDLTVHRGEALGIIGRNGAGKSTLLKILSRITAPTQGTVDIFGRISSMLEVGTGFHGELTGRENVYMNGAILGMTKREIDEKMDDIIEFSEVGEFIDTPVKRYSSGMYVKLAFSVSAHLTSDIMIMDEVLAVGDMAFQQKCLDMMKRKAEEGGRTVLYVSHNMNTIRKLCNRCIVLDEGLIIFDGEPEEAIRIYMDSRRNDDTFVDFRESVYPSWLVHPKIKLEEASFLDCEGAGHEVRGLRETNRFETGERMCLRLQWKALEDFKTTNLRVETRTLDDTPQATFVIMGLCPGVAGQVVSMDIDLGVDMFSEATYELVFTFFEVDELGNQVNMECQRGMCFQRANATRKVDLIWDARNWGHLRLDDYHVMSLNPVDAVAEEEYV